MAKVLPFRTHDPGAISPRSSASRATPCRLDPLLRDTDLRLQLWATWAQPFYLARGFPMRPVGAAVSDGTAAMPHADWPAAVLATDEAVRLIGG
jgi:hypothetical protein